MVSGLRASDGGAGVISVVIMALAFGAGGVANRYRRVGRPCDKPVTSINIEVNGL
jgi:hypothetical protein